MTKTRKKHFLVTLAGTLFYIVSTIGWLWAVLPYVPDIAKLSATLQPQEQAQPVEQVVTTGPPPLLLTIVIIGVTITILVMTVYTLIKLPATIRTSGEKLTHTTSAHIVPILTHHTHLSPKKRRQLTARIAFYIKLALCTLPVVVAACSFLVPASSLSYELTILVATFFAITSLVLFCTQLLLAKWLRIDLDIVW